MTSVVVSQVTPSPVVVEGGWVGNATTADGAHFELGINVGIGGYGVVFGSKTLERLASCLQILKDALHHGL